MGLASVLIAAVTIANFAGAAPVGRAPMHTKQTAEQNLLRSVIPSWGTRRLSALADSRTHLLRNNVQAICRARSRTRFTCVVRRSASRRGPRLLVTYRAFADGRFRLHWLRLRRR